MQSVKKIHFINRIDKKNIGDWACSPLQYYFEYFKQYNLFRHDIDFIDYNEIDREDIVILGGSGLFNVTVSFNEAINKLLEICDNVIAWSVGFNTHNNQWYQGDKFPEIDFSKFKIVTIRDYNHPSQIEYLPCPSVLAFPNPNNDYSKRKRKFGVIEHKDLPIKFPFEVDRITNNESIKNIFDYIRSSEAIVTNSYHCAYWTLVLGRKAIVVNKFSTKFDFYKYKPEFVDISEQDTKEKFEIKLVEAFAHANIYPEFYEEAVNLNNLFFERVKNIIENNNLPKNNDYQDFYQLNVPQFWNTQSEPPKLNHRIDETNHRIDELSHRIEELQNQVHELTDLKNKPFINLLVELLKYKLLKK